MRTVDLNASEVAQAISEFALRKVGHPIGTVTVHAHPLLAECLGLIADAGRIAATATVEVQADEGGGDV